MGSGVKRQRRRARRRPPARRRPDIDRRAAESVDGLQVAVRLANEHGIRIIARQPARRASAHVTFRVRGWSLAQYWTRSGTLLIAGERRIADNVLAATTEVMRAVEMKPGMKIKG
jgi:hypothetical protein